MNIGIAPMYTGFFCLCIWKIDEHSQYIHNVKNFKMKTFQVARSFFMWTNGNEQWKIHERIFILLLTFCINTILTQRKREGEWRKLRRLKMRMETIFCSLVVVSFVCFISAFYHFSCNTWLDTLDTSVACTLFNSP